MGEGYRETIFEDALWMAVVSSGFGGSETFLEKVKQAFLRQMETKVPLGQTVQLLMSGNIVVICLRSRAFTEVDFRWVRCQITHQKMDPVQLAAKTLLHLLPVSNLYAGSVTVIDSKSGIGESSSNSILVYCVHTNVFGESLKPPHLLTNLNIG